MVGGHRLGAGLPLLPAPPSAADGAPAGCAGSRAAVTPRVRRSPARTCPWSPVGLQGPAKKSVTSSEQAFSIHSCAVELSTAHARPGHTRHLQTSTYHTQVSLSS